MENSNKPSSSSVQDVEKKSLANKSTKKMSSSSMKAAKMPVKMQSKKSNPLKKKGTGKVFKKSLAKNTKKGPFKAKSAKKQAACCREGCCKEGCCRGGCCREGCTPKKSTSSTKKGPFKAKSAKKQAATLKKSTSSSEGLLKTRAASNRASLDSLMAGFQTEGRAKTALGMPLKDFSESAVSLLLSNYKVENEKVLSTTALAMSAEASKSKDKTLSSLERYQQFFTEEKTSSLLSPKGSRLLGHAEDLNTEANAALQTLLLVSAMNLTGKRPSGSSLKLASRKSIGLSKTDTKKRLLLIATMAEILHQKSNNFEDKKLSAQLAKIYKDLNKMVADF